ncbi:DUF559 domain-containing protein [Nocardia jejuensis]|uniref:DUF559 domain-containing protein n=1 Tax=Nocardia jejuensis TaxID=328049 RepID=UPI000AC1BD5E|nr:DUF559 domain-containing protein [Nocardia jejuensis]
MIRTRADLLADGVPSSTIDDRCRRGAYTRLLPNVYSLEPPTRITRCEAVIAWLPSAVLSHRTAAWLHGMLPEPPNVEAIVPANIRRETPAWLRIYRRSLAPEWKSELHDLPVTSAALTLMDCVATLGRSEADALIDNQIPRTVNPQEVLDLCHSGIRGSRALYSQLRKAAIHHASEPERLFARALRDRGLTLLANHPIGPFRVDFVDEASRVIVEIDGREFHSAPAVFRLDRRRQNALLLNGWLVLRYAASDIFQSLDACAEETVEVVRRRRRSRRGR